MNKIDLPKSTTYMGGGVLARGLGHNILFCIGPTQLGGTPSGCLGPQYCIHLFSTSHIAYWVEKVELAVLATLVGTPVILSSMLYPFCPVKQMLIPFSLK